MINSFDFDNKEKDRGKFNMKMWFDVLKTYKKKYDLVTLGNYVVENQAIDLDPKILLILQKYAIGTSDTPFDEKPDYFQLSSYLKECLQILKEPK